MTSDRFPCLMKFLSTPSARRATALVLADVAVKGISIHALREEGDALAAALSAMPTIFLSTPSARRATCYRKRKRRRFQISIHALREEGDRPARRGRAPDECISIHALREEGDEAEKGSFYLQDISIHALREEGDIVFGYVAFARNGFLSTPSARRATFRTARRFPRDTYFYPRPPRGGRLPRRGQQDPQTHFYPRPPRGGRPPLLRSTRTGKNFYPRPPRGGRRNSLKSIASGVLFLSTPSARRATKMSGHPLLLQ